MGIVAVLALVGVLAAGCAGKSDRSVRSAAIGSGTPVSGSGSISSPYLLSNAAIRVDEWDWSIKNTSTLGSGTGGASSGRASASEFKITKNIDNASVPLVVLAGNGRNIGPLTFKVGSALTYVLGAPVFVTSVHQSGSGSDGSEDVTFLYGSINMTNTAAGVLTRGGWDFIQNVPN